MSNQFKVNTVKLTEEQEKARVELIEAITQHLQKTMAIVAELAPTFGTGNISKAIKSFDDYRQVIAALREYLDKHLIALNEYAKATAETDERVASGISKELDRFYGKGSGAKAGGAATATAVISGITFPKPPKPGKEDTTTPDDEKKKKEDPTGKGDEDLKAKDEEIKRKDEENKRKDEEIKRKEEEIKRKDDELKNKQKEIDELNKKIKENGKGGPEFKQPDPRTNPSITGVPGNVNKQGQTQKQDVNVYPSTGTVTPSVVPGKTGFDGGTSGSFGGVGKGRESSPSTGLEAFDSALKAENLPEVSENVPEVPIQPEIGASVSDSTIPGNLGTSKTLKGGLLAAGVGAAAAGAAAYSNYKKNKEDESLDVDYNEKSENGLDNQDDIFVNSDSQSFDSQDYYW